MSADLALTAPTLDGSRVAADTAEWSVWSTTARLVVLDADRLADACTLVVEHLAEVDAAVSRFRDDAELGRLDGAGGAPVTVSPLLADHLRAALAAAERTAGDVDPTLGSALRQVGYDRDISALPSATGLPWAVAAPTGRVVVQRRATWRDIALDGTTVTVPASLRLDLGATAKALAADRAAALVADRIGTGVLVSLGGDIATAGPAPDGGWRIQVQDATGEPATTVAIPAGAAIATSSTIKRRWAHDGRAMHHILDPRTLLPAPPVWRTVTVVAATCVEANTLSTATIVRGADGRRLLQDAGVAARLVASDGSVVVVNGWPREQVAS
ncbi:MAG: FAD:protein FMN transferase [Jatrophihabitans sp.]|uniref:FAD:protein FMN transferase n=1 Tax=Jatrophihabitans sp. TaxID=1932789 RepID=UPI003F7E63CB